MNSNQKGKRGEREWAKFLCARGFAARRGQQFKGGDDSPDVVCEDLHMFHPEVKRTERLSVYEAYQQAKTDSGAGQIPYVAHRRNHRDWLAILDADDFLVLVRAYLKQEALK